MVSSTTVAEARQVTVSARVYRAKTDTWEDLGVIAGKPSLLKRFTNWIKGLI